MEWILGSVTSTESALLGLDVGFFPSIRELIHQYQEAIEAESGTNGESSINIYIYGGEGGSRGREYMYNHEWFKLLYGRNQHNTVKKIFLKTLFYSSYCYSTYCPPHSSHSTYSGLWVPSPGSSGSCEPEVHLLPQVSLCTCLFRWLSQRMLGNCKEVPIASPPLFSVSKVSASSNLEVLNMRSTGELQGLWDSLDIA